MIELNNLQLIILSLVCSHFVFGGVIVDNENQLPREAKVCGFFSRPKISNIASTISFLGVKVVCGG